LEWNSADNTRAKALTYKKGANVENTWLM